MAKTLTYTRHLSVVPAGSKRLNARKMVDHQIAVAGADLGGSLLSRRASDHGTQSNIYKEEKEARAQRRRRLQHTHAAGRAEGQTPVTAATFFLLFCCALCRPGEGADRRHRTP